MVNLPSMTIGEEANLSYLDSIRGSARGPISMSLNHQNSIADIVYTASAREADGNPIYAVTQRNNLEALAEDMDVDTVTINYNLNKQHEDEN